MTAKTPCSDRHNGPPASAAPLTVLEGMPGAGKTTTGQRIAATGVQFLGEYTTGSGTTIPIADHPAPGDDDAHQANWLRKAAQTRAALATAGRSSATGTGSAPWPTPTPSPAATAAACFAPGPRGPPHAWTTAPCCSPAAT